MSTDNQGTKPLFTEEEEAQLLAEYGVKDIHDNLINVSAASKFRSEYGDVNVFLTGNLPDDEDNGASDKLPTLESMEHLTASDARLSLDAYVLKYTTALNVDAPLSLLANYDTEFSRKACSDDFPTTRDPSAEETRKKDAKLRALLRESRLKEKQMRILSTTGKPLRVALLSAEVLSEAAIPALSQTNALCDAVDEADKLLQQASAILSKDVTPPPTTSPETPQKPNVSEDFTADCYDRELQREDIFDDESEEEDVELLAQARYYTRAHTAAITGDGGGNSAAVTERPGTTDGATSARNTSAPLQAKAIVRTPALDTQERDKFLAAEREELRRQMISAPATPSLFAYEEVFPTETSEMIPTSISNEAGQVEPPKGAPSPSLVQDFELPPEVHTVLEHIAEMPSRDEALEAASKHIMQEHFRDTCERAEDVAKQEQLAREREGLINFDAFHHRLDALIPPSATEASVANAMKYKTGATKEDDNYTVRTATDAKNDGHGADTKKDGPHTLAAVDTDAPSLKNTGCVLDLHSGVPAPTQSAERIQRAARLELLLAEREAAERRRMRAEDARVEAYYAAAAERLEEITGQVVDCEKEALTTFQTLREAEQRNFDSLLAAHTRNRALAQQAAELRYLKATTELSESVYQQHALGAVPIASAEAEEFGSLMESFRSELQEVVALLKRKQEAELAAERLRLQDHHRAFLTRREAALAASGAPTADARADPVVFTPSGTQAKGFTPRELSPPVASLHSEVTHFHTFCGKQLSSAVARAANVAAEFQIQSSAKRIELRRRVLQVQSGHHNAATADARPSSTGLAPAPTNGTVTLDAEAARNLLSLNFPLAEADQTRANLFFRTVSFALESITNLDYRQLSTLRVVPAAAADDVLSAAKLPPVPHGGPCPSSKPDDWMLRGEPGIPVFPLVRSLDLGSNPLKNFSLRQLLHLAPHIESLRLSDASLRSLENNDANNGNGSNCGTGNSAGIATRSTGLDTTAAPQGSPRTLSASLRSVSAAHMNNAAENVFVCNLDISSNAIESVEELGYLLCDSLRRLHAGANRLRSVEPLLTCRYIVSLELQHNLLPSADALSALPLLRRANVCNNQIPQVEALCTTSTMLRELYASGNTVERLCDSQRQHSFSFLSQLFVNNNRLSSLSSSCIPFFPVLTVLHAEGNGISNITGLDKCRRLHTLNLSLNKLSSLDALAPLLRLPLLQSLSLAGNPVCEASADSSEPLLVITKLLSSSLPLLREFNNELFQRLDTSENVGNDLSSSYGLLSTLSRLRSGERSRHSSGFGLSCFPKLTEDREASVYNEAIDATCANYESVVVAAAQEMRRAETIESALRERAFASGRLFIPSVHELSSQLADSNDVALACGCVLELQRLRDGTPTLPTSSTVRSSVHLMNRVERNPSYERRLLMARKANAGALVATWLEGRLRVRRAKAELAALREAYQRSEAFRREQAARRIQPVWRGAAFRSRLKRIMASDNLGGLGDDDDDGEFKKIDLDDLGPPDDADATNLATLFKKVLGGQEPLRNFDVPAAPMFPPTFSALAPERASSAPEQTKVDARGHVVNTLRIDHSGDGFRPSSTGAAPSRAGTSPGGASAGATPTPRKPTIAEEWGTTVASQIKKKNKKMDSMHAQRVRSEYISNPLNAKKDTYGRK